MARFYGFSDKEIRVLSFHTFNEYAASIEKIEAHETLLAIQSTAYPHTEAKDQRKKLNDLKEICRVEPLKELDSAELAKALGFI